MTQKLDNILNNLLLDDNSPLDRIKEKTVNRDEAEHAARNSLDFLAALAMPLIFKYLFPSVYKTIWSWLILYASKQRDFSQLAIGLPRGFSKTTLIKLFVIFCILFTKKRFILLVGGTQTKANNVLLDIFTMLSEKNIISIFGDWRIGVEEIDRQDTKKFGFRGRSIILMAAGAGADIRGITLNNERPDLMVFDDIQTRDEADSEQVSSKLETWLYGTALKAKSPEGCLFIFIANMYPTKWSLLRRIKHNPQWVKFIAGGILDDGTSLWEDLQPIQQLLKEYENDLSAGKPEIFFAEVLNDENATVNTHINIDNLPSYPFLPDEISAGNFIVIDPATDKQGADDVSIGYFEIYNGTPVIKEIIAERLSPGDTISKALQLALRNNCTVIAIESNAYQYTLNYWFKHICTQLGISGIHPIDIYSGKYSKNSRILNMFKELLAGELYIHPKCRAQVHTQISGFNPMRKDNTDGILDLLTYAGRVIEQAAGLISFGTILEEQEFNSAKVYTEIENSPF